VIEIGYSLSSEEHAPADLVRQAVDAEAAGYTFALISDHFHPWTDRQGSSPFARSVIGAVAQAAASGAMLMPGRVRRCSRKPLR
jgi:coenzyme F420-dependent glucose-6-phosphate dehydrogenase